MKVGGMLKIAGVVLMTYLLVRLYGMPWGLLWGAAVAMLFLP